MGIQRIGETMQQVTLIGHAGQDAELRTTGGGTTMAKFSLATKEREKTEWWSVTVFGQSAENAARLITKGMKVFVQGRFDLREYEQQGNKRFSLDVVADKWELCSGGPHQRGEQHRPPPQTRTPAEPRRSQQKTFDGYSDKTPAEQSWDSGPGATNDDDIPF